MAGRCVDPGRCQVDRYSVI